MARDKTSIRLGISADTCWRNDDMTVLMSNHPQPNGYDYLIGEEPPNYPVPATCEMIDTYLTWYDVTRWKPDTDYF